MVQAFDILTYFVYEERDYRWGMTHAPATITPWSISSTNQFLTLAIDLYLELDLYNLNLNLISHHKPQLNLTHNKNIRDF